MKGTAFKDLVGGLRRVLAALPDRRKGKNLSYARKEGHWVKKMEKALRPKSSMA